MTRKRLRPPPDVRPADQARDLEARVPARRTCPECRSADVYVVRSQRRANEHGTRTAQTRLQCRHCGASYWTEVILPAHERVVEVVRRGLESERPDEVIE